jgi:hypothetical protein
MSLDFFRTFESEWQAMSKEARNFLRMDKEGRQHYLCLALKKTPQLPTGTINFVLDEKIVRPAKNLSKAAVDCGNVEMFAGLVNRDPKGGELGNFILGRANVIRENRSNVHTQLRAMLIAAEKDRMVRYLCNAAPASFLAAREDNYDVRHLTIEPSNRSVACRDTYVQKYFRRWDFVQQSSIDVAEFGKLAKMAAAWVSTIVRRGRQDPVVIVMQCVAGHILLQRNARDIDGFATVASTMVLTALRQHNQRSFSKLKYLAQLCPDSGFSDLYTLFALKVLGQYKGQHNLHLLMFWCIKVGHLSLMVALLSWKKVPRDVLRRGYLACHSKIFTPTQRFSTTVDNLRVMLVLLGACGAMADDDAGPDQATAVWSTDVASFLMSYGRLSLNATKRMMSSGSLAVRTVFVDVDHFFPSVKLCDEAQYCRQKTATMLRTTKWNQMNVAEKKSACTFVLCTVRKHKDLPQELAMLILSFAVPRRDCAVGGDFPVTEMHGGEIVY